MVSGAADSATDGSAVLSGMVSSLKGASAPDLSSTGDGDTWCGNPSPRSGQRSTMDARGSARARTREDKRRPDHRALRRHPTIMIPGGRPVKWRRDCLRLVQTCHGNARRPPGPEARPRRLNCTAMSKESKAPLWGGRFGSSPAETFGRLNASIPFDVRLAPHDIRGSVAHAKMLGRQGIVSPGESAELVRGLETVLREVEAGEFSWTLSDEDVHTAVERRLREVAGDVALKLHTGRSRNDQVALDLRLFVREAAEEIKDRVLAAMQALVDLAEKHGDLVLPGYTHLQRAQPILLSHHLLAHFEALKRDLRRLQAAREAANVSPLGAAALGGTPHPVDPALTAAELGMEPFSNSLDAVSERDFALDLLYACAVLGMHLSRLGEDWVLWTSSEFGFATVDDAYTSGSSIMPQKKNPDAYELMRGKAGRLIGSLNAVLITLK